MTPSFSGQENMGKCLVQGKKEEIISFGFYNGKQSGTAFTSTGR
jgi:hypothetical protein